MPRPDDIDLNKSRTPIRDARQKFSRVQRPKRTGARMTERRHGAVFVFGYDLRNFGLSTWTEPALIRPKCMPPSLVDCGIWKQNSNFMLGQRSTAMCTTTHSTNSQFLWRCLESGHDEMTSSNKVLALVLCNTTRCAFATNWETMGCLSTHFGRRKSH